MISAILMNDKAENGRPNVKIGDKIQCRDGQAIITDIDDETWSIKWDSGDSDTVISMLQHNWKKV